jgi:hypothetical protein
MAENTNKAATPSTGSKDNRPNPFAFGVRLDRAKRELHISATRAVAGVSVASFCGLLIGVVALSRNATDTGPQSARASATARPVSIVPSEDQPPKPDAPKRETPKLTVAPVVPTVKAVAPTAPPTKTTAAATAKPAPAATAVRLDKSEDVSPTAPRPTPTTSVAPPVIADQNEPAAKEERVGQTYLVLGSYRTLPEAQAALTKFRAHGVDCTVERSLPGYTKRGWYSVMSARGFKSTQDKAYQRELKTLQEKGLEPASYRWRAASKA